MNNNWEDDANMKNTHLKTKAGGGGAGSDDGGVTFGAAAAAAADLC